MTAAAW